MSRFKLWVGAVFAGTAVLGCAPTTTPTNNSTASAPQSAPAGSAPAAAPQASTPRNRAAEVGGVDVGGPQASAPQTNAAQVPNAAAPEQPVVAQQGVGKRGQSLRNETGIGKMIATPAVTLFAVEQRAVFDIQIPKAMQLWEASNGRKPKSHEEFMSQIIKANQIKLPELPAGKTYQYHPDDAQLWVHPAGQ